MCRAVIMNLCVYSSVYLEDRVAITTSLYTCMRILCVFEYCSTSPCGMKVPLEILLFILKVDNDAMNPSNSKLNNFLGKCVPLTPMLSRSSRMDDCVRRC